MCCDLDILLTLINLRLLLHISAVMIAVSYKLCIEIVLSIHFEQALWPSYLDLLTHAVHSCDFLINLWNSCLILHNYISIGYFLGVPDLMFLKNLFKHFPELLAQMQNSIIKMFLKVPSTKIPQMV